MRAIEFQDSLYRSQPAEKVISRDQNKTMDDVQLAALKKMQQDAVKQTVVNQAEESRGKQVDKDRPEGEQSEARKKEDKEKEDKEAEKKSRRRPQGGSLIDIDA